MASTLRPYAWKYLDARFGDFTLVVILMRAPVFSTRELWREWRGLPSLQAINVALYHRHRCVRWVLNEYAEDQQPARLLPDQAMKIGGAELLYNGSFVDLRVAERDLWGNDVSFSLRLETTTPLAPEVTLSDGLQHRWQAIMPRAIASLDAGTLPLPSQKGFGYHDMNFGDVPLGTDLRRWVWSRRHDERRTQVRYAVGPTVWTLFCEDGVQPRVTRSEERSGSASWSTAWGLQVPTSVAFDSGTEPSGVLHESSPFYARLSHNSAMTEVADFSRMRSPMFAWMPLCRSRFAGRTPKKDALLVSGKRALL